MFGVKKKRKVIITVIHVCNQRNNEDGRQRRKKKTRDSWRGMAKHEKKFWSNLKRVKVPAVHRKSNTLATEKNVKELKRNREIMLIMFLKKVPA